MSAPNKGKDLSALKARLASKAGAAPTSSPQETPQRAPAQPTQPSRAQAPTPAAVTPRHEAEEQAPVSRQQEVQPRTSARASAYPEAAVSEPEVNDPFGGGKSFDPTKGVIDDGGADIRSKFPVGLLVGAALGGVVLGGIVGYVAATKSELSAKVTTARAKAAEMTAEVEKTKNARAAVAVAWEEVSKDLRANPAKGAAKLKEITGAFTEHGKVENLFGWQLASMGKGAIKSSFSLYDHANSLQIELGQLAGFVASQGGLLAEDIEVSKLGVVFKEGAPTMLVEIVDSVCGDLKAARECARGDEIVGYKVRYAPGGKEVDVEKETVREISRNGPLYSAVVNSKPSVDARRRLEFLTNSIKEHLDKMSGYEKATLDALAKYVESPAVDAASAPSE